MTATPFSPAFAVAAPFWALMILLPHWSWTRRIVASPLIVPPPVLTYALLVIPSFGEVLPAVASPTPRGVCELLETAVRHGDRLVRQKGVRAGGQPRPGRGPDSAGGGCTRTGGGGLSYTEIAERLHIGCVTTVKDPYHRSRPTSPA
jgi:hypothetical protein